METQYISLNMTPTGVNPCFHISQYDIGRSLGFIIYNGSEVVDLDSYTCTVEATRSDGVAITANVSTNDNVGTFETTATMTNKADKYKAQFIIVDGDSNRIASLPFDMDVCKAAMDENSESIEEDASLYQQYTEAVQGAIAEANADIQVEENARIAAVAAEATARANADTALQGNIDSEASTRAAADSNLQSQINQIIAPSGEAPSAAEVQNARIGANGVTYDTLGNAIRGQVSDLKNAIDNINGRFELAGDAQLFNKYEAIILKDAAINGSGQIVSLDNHDVVVIPISGSYGEYYLFKSFNQNLSISYMLFWAHTSLPSIGATLTLQGTTNNTNLRGQILLNGSYSYLAIAVGTISNIEDFTDYLVVKKDSYPVEYVEYYETVKETAENTAQSVFNSSITPVDTAITTINNRFEKVVGDQKFNKDACVVLDNAYVNSSKEITSGYDLYSLVTMEVNGIAGSTYSFKVFNSNSSFSLLSVYATNTLPVMNGSVEEKGITNNTEKKGHIELSGNKKYIVFCIPTTVKTEFINGLMLILSGSYPEEYENYEVSTLTVCESIDKSKDTTANIWNGKTIWWCGTSIPEGQDEAIDSEGYGFSYPELVGQKLGATVINKSLGSSMCRANVRTGDYVDAYSLGLVRALTQTLEEKNYLINNWSTIRSSLHDPNTYASLDDIATTVRGSSFENLLTPYLDGTYDMPDLFVIDHGHNDWKSFYTMPDGTTPDTELKPTVANITGNILAEDTFMTDNSYAKLISVMGEISAIPVSKLDDFIASINRNCFIGAVNFLCTYILSKNPRARIVFIGNLDNWEKPQVQPAQDAIAESWEFPIIRVWESTGFSDHYIPNTADFWNDGGTSDLTMKSIYCKDGTHPHSDTTGRSIELYANIIAGALKNLE